MPLLSSLPPTETACLLSGIWPASSHLSELPHPRSLLSDPLLRSLGILEPPWWLAENFKITCSPHQLFLPFQIHKVMLSNSSLYPQYCTHSCTCIQVHNKYCWNIGNISKPIQYWHQSPHHSPDILLKIIMRSVRTPPPLMCCVLVCPKSSTYKHSLITY